MLRCEYRRRVYMQYTCIQPASKMAEFVTMRHGPTVLDEATRGKERRGRGRKVGERCPLWPRPYVARTLRADRHPSGATRYHEDRKRAALKADHRCMIQPRATIQRTPVNTKWTSATNTRP